MNNPRFRVCDMCEFFDRAVRLIAEDDRAMGKTHKDATITAPPSKLWPESPPPRKKHGDKFQGTIDGMFSSHVLKKGERYDD